jgi:hypothetical protein
MDALHKFIGQLKDNLGPTVKKAIKDQIDLDVQQTYDKIRSGTPTSNKPHVHLVDSLTKIKIDDGQRYGWKIEYAGYNEYNIPFDLIAKALNKGNAFLAGTKHIDVGRRMLKGIDNRISERVKRDIDQLVEKGGR